MKKVSSNNITWNVAQSMDDLHAWKEGFNADVIEGKITCSCGKKCHAIKVVFNNIPTEGCFVCEECYVKFPDSRRIQ